MSRVIVILVIGILFSSGHIAGCAGPGIKPIEYNSDNNQKFVPINLKVSCGLVESEFEDELADYIYVSFKKSGLFSAIDAYGETNSVTIKIKYTLEQPMSAKVFTGAVISAASLLLIPGQIDEIHTLRVQILNEDKILKSATYTEQVTAKMSLYHNALDERKIGINKALKQLFDDIRDNNLLPLNSE